MPLGSLEFMRRHFGRLDGSRPIVALHSGNFVGVSLAFLAQAVSGLNAGSKVARSTRTSSTAAWRGPWRPSWSC